jgi:midchain alkane hydroxylase
VRLPIKFWRKPAFVYFFFLCIAISSRIRTRRAEQSLPDAPVREDILSRMMKENADLTNEFIRDQILNLLVAARDTTANALTWAMYLFSKHPEACERVCGLRKSQDDPSYEECDSADPYLQACMREALRLYPSVPFDPKYCTKDCVLPSGIHIRQGMTVSYQPYLMGRSEALYDCPTEFRPERWTLGKNGGIPLEQGLALPFPVFQWGKRLCLGWKMAEIEIQTALLHVLPRYKFELVEEPQMAPKITMHSANGLKMRVTRRK